MTDVRALEARLADAYAVAPPDGFGAVDRRVASLAAEADAPRPRRRWRGLRVALALAAALLLLAGATVAAVRLLEVLAGATPGTSVVLNKGVVLGERQVHGDYAITLERAYGDINRVVVVLSIERADRSGHVRVEMSPNLVDPAGHVLDRDGTDVGATEGNAMAETFTFAPATSTEGDYTLQVTTGRDSPVWTYAFRLPAPVGSIVEVGRTIHRSGAAVSVGEVRLSPTMISASIRVHSSEPDIADWATIGFLRHGDHTIEFALEHGSADDDEGSIVSTVEGADPASGEWTLTVTEMVGERFDETQVRLRGPWEFTFDVP
jgi:hypothetical protein